MPGIIVNIGLIKNLVGIFPCNIMGNLNKLLAKPILSPFRVPSLSKEKTDTKLAIKQKCCQGRYAVSWEDKKGSIPGWLLEVTSSLSNGCDLSRSELPSRLIEFIFCVKIADSVSTIGSELRFLLGFCFFGARCVVGGCVCGEEEEVLKSSCLRKIMLSLELTFFDLPLFPGFLLALSLQYSRHLKMYFNHCMK